MSKFAENLIEKIMKRRSEQASNDSVQPLQANNLTQSQVQTQGQNPAKEPVQQLEKTIQKEPEVEDMDFTEIRSKKRKHEIPAKKSVTVVRPSTSAPKAKTPSQPTKTKVVQNNSKIQTTTNKTTKNMATDGQKSSTSRQTNKNNNTNTDKDEEQKGPKVPPVMINPSLIEKLTWTQVNTHCIYNDIKLEEVKILKSGDYKISPKTSNDHRALTTTLSNNNIQYHSYVLPEDKTTKVVIHVVDPLGSCEDYLE